MNMILKDIDTILGNVTLFAIHIVVAIIYIIAFITLPIWIIPYLIRCKRWYNER